MPAFVIILCLLLLGLAFLSFVRFLWVHGPVQIDSRWMYVSSVDENSNRIGRGRWVRTPKPDRIDTNGLNHVAKYVARLVKSQGTHASLIVASLDGEKACLIMRQDGVLKVMEHAHRPPASPMAWKPSWHCPNLTPDTPEPELEQAIRALFADLDIAPDIDEVEEYGGYADAVLHYPIGNDVAQATFIIQRLLREVYHIQDTDALEFTFEG